MEDEPGKEEVLEQDVIPISVEYVLGDEQMETVVGEESVNIEDTQKIEKDFLIRYLDGEISFGEYAALINEEEEESDNEEEAAIPTEQPREGAEPVETPNLLENIVKTRRRKTASSKLHPTLKGVVGEANLCFARGDHQKAIDLCMEVVREDAYNPEPFHTLSMIYEEKGDIEKCYQYSLIAAHVRMCDGDEWTRLAEMSLELGHEEQARICYSKAYNCDRQNVDLLKTFSSLLERTGQTMRLKSLYGRALRGLGSHQGDTYFDTATALAKIYYEQEKFDRAIEVLKGAFEKHADRAQPEHLNLLLDVILHVEDYEQSWRILLRYGGVSTDPPLTEDTKFEDLISVQTPEFTPVDIYSKLIVTLIQLDAISLAQSLVPHLMTFNREKVGDLYLDVAEAFTQKQCYQEAIELLKTLTQTEKYNQPAVLWELGQNQQSAGLINDAMATYRILLKIVPQDTDARMKLSELLEQQGMSDDALGVLQPDGDGSEPLDVALLYQRCQILKAKGRNEEFINTAKLLMGKHFPKVTSRAQIDQMMTFGISYKGCFKSESPLNDMDNTDTLEFTDTHLSITQEWQLFVEVCALLYEKKRFSELQELAFLAVASRRFGTVPKISRFDKATVQKECYFLGGLSAYFNKDYSAAFNIVREFVTRYVGNNQALNLLNLVICNSNDMRYCRFVMRLLGRHPDHLGLIIMNGNTSLLSGTYKFSLNDFMSAIRTDPTNPLLALKLGICYTHLTCQRFYSKKHSLVVQACAFFNTYLQLRGEGQETFYNIGRAMHQLGILHTALYFYKKALEYPPMIESDEKMDLKREIAFNISLIYRSSGNNDLARMYLFKYIHV